MSNENQYNGLRQHSRQSNDNVRRKLKEAIISLAKHSDYADITVTRLCEKAGVSRMAFYRNFAVTNDVIYEVANDLNNEVIGAVGSPFRISTSLEWYVKAFEMIAAHKEEMTLMFQENFQYQWMKIVNTFAVHDPRFPPEQKYQRVMWSGGFENAVSYWLNTGMQESPEQMAEYCYQYLPHLLVSQEAELRQQPGAMFF